MGAGSKERPRRGLFWRLFGAGALIAVLATAAASFATVRSTTVGVRDQQRQSLHDDARVYDALMGYAAVHRSWAGAAAVVGRWADELDEPIVVTDPAGRPLIDSSAGAAGGAATGTVRDPRGARAVLDPLDVDTTLLPPPLAAVPADSGPTKAADCAARPTECRFRVTGTTAIDPRVDGALRGRPRQAALQRLVGRVDRCLARAGVRPIVTVLDDLSVVVDHADRHAAVATCLDGALRGVLGPSVAPRALLFVGDDATRADLVWQPSAGGWWRIVLLALAVLGATLVVCALLARRVLRPLDRMSRTAHLAAEGDLSARVDYRGRDEFGELAEAFNAMADRREQLEAARRRMVSDVSHELRTPVANARAWLEGAQDGLAEVDEGFVDSLLEEMLHLQGLIEDLHQLSLGDAGELRIERERFEIAPVVEQVAASFRVAADAAGVELVVDAEPGAVLDADPRRLRQALSNLVANSLRHTPRGGRIELRATSDRIDVVDTGEGVPSADVDLVFERFHRADASRNRSSGGSGLGLAIVRQIAEAHGGTATLSSVEGVGTTVSIVLPVRG